MTHPPFNGYAAPRPQREWDTKDGAHRLAAIIRGAWADVGHDVPVVIVETNPGHPETHYSVRMPTLVNGLPAGRGR
jgi:hypothetical protein